MSAKTIVGFGEALWDLFEDGARFGGAPANFACMATALAGGAAKVALVSAVGSDELGERALAELRSRGVETSCVAVADAPTGTVGVRLDARGQPDYRIVEGVAWDFIPASEHLDALAVQADAVCFGSLAQRGDRSRRTLRSFLSATRPDCLRVFDINLRPPFWSAPLLLESLALANVLKLNDGELAVLAGLLGLAGSHEVQMRDLRSRFSLRAIALTLGDDGSILLDESGIDVRPPAGVEVVDTVGAGDSFTAALVVGMLAGGSLGAIHRSAAAVAGYVCTQAGATPAVPADIRALFDV